jgi:hypothetical protein
MRILISYEDSYHLYSDALERAFSALLSSIHRSAWKGNSAKFAKDSPFGGCAWYPVLATVVVLYNAGWGLP